MTDQNQAIRQLPRSRVRIAEELMLDFAERTGVSSGSQERYLWTDAFAVCNFLGLAEITRNDRYCELALTLIERTHEELGRQRREAFGRDWLSGPAGPANAEHPTRAGLRIGKPLAERAAGEALDPRLEWDRDGQYFHYLTKWMHALDQAAWRLQRPHLNRYARELAETAHQAFTYVEPRSGQKRMHWKMSVNLFRPLVSSMGHHDPLDGYITAVELEASAQRLNAQGPSLNDEIRDYRAMLPGINWATADPLGIGGLLTDAQRVHQLIGEGALEDDGLLGELLGAARFGLDHYAVNSDQQAPAARRLAFRELGLVIGLHAAEFMRDDLGDMSVHNREQLFTLLEHVSLANQVEDFWLTEENRRAPSWNEHLNINSVMLATSLEPRGFVLLRE